MSASKPANIVIENPRYGKIEWTFPENVLARFNGLGNAEVEAATIALGQIAAKVFGTVLYCYMVGQLPDLEAFVTDSAKNIKAPDPPKTH